MTGPIRYPPAPDFPADLDAREAEWEEPMPWQKTKPEEITSTANKISILDPKLGPKEISPFAPQPTASDALGVNGAELFAQHANRLAVQGTITTLPSRRGRLRHMAAAALILVAIVAMCVLWGEIFNGVLW